MEKEVGGNGRFNEVGSGSTSPYLYSLCSMSEEQGQGTTSLIAPSVMSRHSNEIMT